jgi:hypothetical protein
MVRLGTTRSDYLVVDLAWQRQVGKTVAMHVAHLLSAVPVLGAAEPVRQSLHSGPGRDRFLDPSSRSLHKVLARQLSYRVALPNRAGHDHPAVGAP